MNAQFKKYLKELSNIDSKAVKMKHTQMCLTYLEDSLMEKSETMTKEIIDEFSNDLDTVCFWINSQMGDKVLNHSVFMNQIWERFPHLYVDDNEDGIQDKVLTLDKNTIIDMVRDRILSEKVFGDNTDIHIEEGESNLSLVVKGKVINNQI